MSLMHKPTLYDDPATCWLMKQSKAALADMLTEVLRLEQESCDEPATAEAAEVKWAGILERRKGLRRRGRLEHLTPGGPAAAPKEAAMGTCGFCGGRGWVLRNSYDREGRARSEAERRMGCEYCDGAGVCEDGHKLLPVRESPQADPADLRRVGLPPWA